MIMYRYGVYTWQIRLEGDRRQADVARLRQADLARAARVPRLAHTAPGLQCLVRLWRHFQIHEAASAPNA